MIALGLTIRRASAPLALALSVLLVAAALLGLSSGGVAEPIALLYGVRRPATIVTALWESTAIATTGLVAARMLAIATGALGWSLLPRTHRDFLTRATK